MTAPAINGITQNVAAATTVGSSSSSVKELNADLLTITRHPNPPPPNFENLVFGKKFSPHMLVIPWSQNEGWGQPEIKPYGPLSISPAAPVLHYASGLFEGMKAYRSADGSGKIRLFRPERNMQRMNQSASRCGLPTFNGDEFIKMLQKLVLLDQDYVPHEMGQTLYLRPTLIGTPDSLGMGVPSEALLYCICSPVGNYYSSGSGMKPVSLFASTEAVRAWPGGTGCYKLAANYAGPTVPALEAQKKGYDQVLWLFGPDRQLTEVGAMNLFVVFRDSEKYEITTAPLSDGTILPGVTRDSILSLLRMYVSGQIDLPDLPPRDQIVISERKVTMDQVISANNESRLVEIFGSGTAACVCSVDRIGFEGKDYLLPTDQNGTISTFTRVLLREVTGRQWGIIPHLEWSFIC